MHEVKVWGGVMSRRTIFLFFYLLFITCTFIVGHMTDDLPFAHDSFGVIHYFLT